MCVCECECECECEREKEGERECVCVKESVCPAYFRLRCSYLSVLCVQKNGFTELLVPGNRILCQHLNLVFKMATLQYYLKSYFYYNGVLVAFV